MQVKEIMTQGTEMISSDTNLTQAAQKMKSIEVGALPIQENGELVGIITDRDITIRAVANGMAPSNTPVKEIMTPEVFYCFEDNDIKKAAEMMKEKSIHRLLVLDRESNPVGFVSLADFAVKGRDEHLAWEILEKISEPACPNR